jgi:hypothetical protein
MVVKVYISYQDPFNTCQDHGDLNAMNQDQRGLTLKSGLQDGPVLLRIIVVYLEIRTPTSRPGSRFLLFVHIPLFLSQKCKSIFRQGERKRKRAGRGEEEEGRERGRGRGQGGLESSPARGRVNRCSHPL